MLPDLMVVLFAAHLYIIESHQVAGAYKDASGIWGEDRLRLVCGNTKLYCKCNIGAVHWIVWDITIYDHRFVVLEYSRAHS